MEPVILRGGCHRPGHASSTMTKLHLPGEHGRIGGPAKLGFAAGHLVKGKTLSLHYSSLTTQHTFAKRRVMGMGRWACRKNPANDELGSAEETGKAEEVGCGDPLLSALGRHMASSAWAGPHYYGGMGSVMGVCELQQRQAALGAHPHQHIHVQIRTHLGAKVTLRRVITVLCHSPGGVNKGPAYANAQANAQASACVQLLAASASSRDSLDYCWAEPSATLPSWASWAWFWPFWGFSGC